MGFELGDARLQSCLGLLRLAASFAISNWFRWSLPRTPVQTYEVKALFAIRFLLPFPAKPSSRVKPLADRSARSRWRQSGRQRGIDEKGRNRSYVLDKVRRDRHRWSAQSQPRLNAP